MSTRSTSRSDARLAAVQALYQQDMEGIPLPQLLHEFHHHRLGATGRRGSGVGYNPSLPAGRQAMRGNALWYLVQLTSER